MTKIIKLACGEEVEVKPLTWKQAKQIKLVSMLSKYQKEDEVMSIDEEDMDKVISIVVPEDIQEKLTIEDAINIFTAVVEGTFSQKK